MKVGNNGLKINAGLVKMQHKSNLVSQMLSGGNSMASMSSLMGGGSARTQAMSIMKQMDTFDRLSSLTSGDTGTYSAGSAKGTAREQAKEIMKEYEESQRAVGKTSGEAAAAEDRVAASGEQKLSEKAQDYLAGLRKQYGDVDFIVVDDTDNERELVNQSTKEYTVVMTGDEVEKMSSDEDFAKEQLRSMETTWRMNDRINQQYGYTRSFGQTNATGKTT